MKRILTLGLLALLNIVGYSQTVVFGPETFNTTLGNFTPVNNWSIGSPAFTSNTYTGASGGTAATLTVNTSSVTSTLTTTAFSTVGLRNLTAQFSEWKSSGLLNTTGVRFQYSIDPSNTTWSDVTAFTSANSTTTHNALRTISLPSVVEGVSSLKLRFFFSGSTSGSSKFYYIDDFKVSGEPFIASTVFYNKVDSDLSDLANWGDQTDGSGTGPLSFEENDYSFVVKNGTANSFNSEVVISGTGSKLYIGDGTNPAALTANALFLATIDVRNGGLLTLPVFDASDFITFDTLATGSTVEYSSVANQGIVPSNYSNLKLSGSGSKLLSSGLTTTINNNFDLGTGLSVVLGTTANSILALNGTVTGTSTIYSNSNAQILVNKSAGGNVGTIYFDASNNEINNVTVTAGTLTLGTPFKLGGTSPKITIGSSGGFDAGANSITLTADNDAVIHGTFYTSNANGIKNDAGTATFNFEPTFANGSNIVYNASSNGQIVTPRQAVDRYYNLTLTGGSKVFQTGNSTFYTINGDFVDNTNHNHTVPTGTLFEFSGSNQLVAPISYSTLVLSGSGTKTLSSTDSTYIARTLTINNGAQLVTNGKLVMLSQVNEKPAALIDNSASGILGNVTVRRFMTPKSDPNNPANPPAWLLSSPVSSVTVSVFTPSRRNIFDYFNSRAAGTRFVAIPETTQVIPGKGYLVRTASEKIIHFHGPVNNGNISVGITAAGDNYNLIGNPYPSRIEWNSSKIDMTHIGGSQQIRVFHSGLNAQGGTAYDIYNLNTVIPMCQAFFVQAGSTGNVVFTNAARTDEVLGMNLQRVENEYSNRLKIYLRLNNKLGDVAIAWAQKSEANSTKFNRWFDLEKMMPSAIYPALYMDKEGTKVDLFAFSENEETVTIPLTTVLPKDSVYKFVIQDINQISPDYNILLKDNTDNTIHDLRETDTVSFSSNSGTFNRFSLVYTKRLITGLDEEINKQMYLYSKEGLVTINSNTTPSYISIRDISGKMVYSNEAPSGTSTTADLTSHPSGVYFATINAGSGNVYRKFILNK